MSRYNQRLSYSPRKERALKIYTEDHPTSPVSKSSPDLDWVPLDGLGHIAIATRMGCSALAVFLGDKLAGVLLGDSVPVVIIWHRNADQGWFCISCSPNPPTLHGQSWEKSSVFCLICSYNLFSQLLGTNFEIHQPAGLDLQIRTDSDYYLQQLSEVKSPLAVHWLPTWPVAKRTTQFSIKGFFLLFFWQRLCIA